MFSCSLGLEKENPNRKYILSLFFFRFLLADSRMQLIFPFFIQNLDVKGKETLEVGIRAIKQAEQAKL